MIIPDFRIFLEKFNSVLFIITPSPVYSHELYISEMKIIKTKLLTQSTAKSLKTF